MASGIDPATAYIDSGLTNGTNAYYVVTACNGNGESAASGEGSATPLSSINSSTIDGYIVTFSGGTDTMGCSTYAADGLERGTFADRPGFSGLNSLTTANLPFIGTEGENFSLYIFYLPPPDLAGPSVYVPMTLFPWKAAGTCKTSDLVNWTQSDAASGFSSSSTYPWPFPTW